MTRAYRPKRDPVHIAEILAELGWVTELTAEAEREGGPLRGAITPRQRPWSAALDQLEAERQALDEDAA